MSSRTQAPRTAQEIANLGHCRLELLVVHRFLAVFVDCCKDLKIGVLQFLLKPPLGLLGGLLQRVQIRCVQLALRQSAPCENV